MDGHAEVRFSSCVRGVFERLVLRTEGGGLRHLRIGDELDRQEGVPKQGRSLQSCDGSLLTLVRKLAVCKSGITQKELLEAAVVSSGGNGKRYLKELEQCGFIRKFTSFGKRKRDAQYQLIDCFTLFHLKFLEGESYPDEHYWQHSVNSPRVNA